ncbi:MAG: DUF3311 domain-containing protein [Luteolibacter sp.]
MKKPIVISILAFVVLFILHHDFWNWGDRTLVFGFIPVGLAYHVGYSIAAAGLWYLVCRFAWPHSIEKWADEPND